MTIMSHIASVEDCNYLSSPGITECGRSPVQLSKRHGNMSRVHSIAYEMLSAEQKRKNTETLKNVLWLP